MTCGRYQPQAADTYTDDYRFAPLNTELNPTPPTYNVHSYFSSRGSGVKYTTQAGVTLLGAAQLATAASTAALLTLMW